MPLSFRHLTSSAQLERADMDVLMDHAERMEKVLDKGGDDRMHRKTLASLFYEPSTRTRFSFEAAMYRMGGNVITADGLQFSSLYKGESIRDSIRVITNPKMVDIACMRHPAAGSADEAALYSQVPFINAGDGQNQHPSQALLDAYTIRKEKGRMEDLTIAMVGDLKFGRTVHSLSRLMGQYRNIYFKFIAPDGLQMPDAVKNALHQDGVQFEESEVMEEALNAHVIYMTRIQRERFGKTEEDEALYQKAIDTYVLNANHVRGTDVTVMHPLPRLKEIAEDVDDLPNAAYFRQAENGLPVRMALLDLMLDEPGKWWIRKKIERLFAGAKTGTSHVRATDELAAAA